MLYLWGSTVFLSRISILSITMRNNAIGLISRLLKILFHLLLMKSARKDYSDSDYYGSFAIALIIRSLLPKRNLIRYYKLKKLLIETRQIFQLISSSVIWINLSYSIYNDSLRTDNNYFYTESF